MAGYLGISGLIFTLASFAYLIIFMKYLLKVERINMIRFSCVLNITATTIGGLSVILPSEGHIRIGLAFYIIFIISTAICCTMQTSTILSFLNTKEEYYSQFFMIGFQSFGFLTSSGYIVLAWMDIPISLMFFMLMPFHIATYFAWIYLTNFKKGRSSQRRKTPVYQIKRSLSSVQALADFEDELTFAQVTKIIKVIGIVFLVKIIQGVMELSNSLNNFDIIQVREAEIYAANDSEPPYFIEQLYSILILSANLGSILGASISSLMDSIPIWIWPIVQISIYSVMFSDALFLWGGYIRLLFAFLSGCSSSICYSSCVQNIMGNPYLKEMDKHKALGIFAFVPPLHDLIGSIYATLITKFVFNY